MRMDDSNRIWSMLENPSSANGVCAALPPRSLGAITAAISCTQPWRIAAVESSGPHSHSTRLHPFAARLSMRCCGSQWGKANRSGPTGRDRLTPSGPWATSVAAVAVSHSCAEEGRSRLLDKTTRNGSGSLLPRVVRRGSSLRTVPPPTMTASHPARKAWTQRRAIAPEIHWL